MDPQETSKSKRSTLQLYGTINKYDTYKRTMSITPNLYRDNFLFYNDSVAQRHQRNKQEIKKLLDVISSKQMTTDMLEYNTQNAFYPSYVLYHHFGQFCQLVGGLAQFYQPLRVLLPDFKSGQVLGAIFDRTIGLNFKGEAKVEVSENGVNMAADTYFYSFKTSPYIHICCFEYQKNKKNLYIFIQLRNEKSELCPGIEIRDLGATLSPDYLSVGYRFNGVKPLLVVEASSGKLYRSVVSNDSVVELGYSLQDLANCLYVTVKYTSMRRQFTTLEKSKAERPIGQYQAVTSRIVDGFSTLFGLSFLRQRLLAMPEVSNFMRYYLSFMHQIILERIIDLRECCGGYGYMQISGHPGFLERTSLRSAQPALTVVPDNNEVMKRIHYYSSDDSREAAYLMEISPEGNQINDIFYYFVAICIRMRQNREQMNSREYMKQFLRQACIQMMYTNTYYDSVDPTSPTENLFPYTITKYVLKHSKFLNWSLMKTEPEKLHEMLSNKRNELLQKITPLIPKLTDIMEIGYLRNVIVGEEDSNAFYRKVMEASASNRRNSQEYKDYVLKDLIEVIKEQRAQRASL